MTHRVTLSVGNVFVTGEGPSPQAARHHAAQQALEQLRNETSICKAQLDGKFFRLYINALLLCLKLIKII